MRIHSSYKLVNTSLIVFTYPKLVPLTPSPIFYIDIILCLVNYFGRMTNQKNAVPK